MRVNLSATLMCAIALETEIEKTILGKIKISPDVPGSFEIIGLFGKPSFLVIYL